MLPDSPGAYPPLGGCSGLWDTIGPILPSLGHGANMRRPALRGQPPEPPPDPAPRGAPRGRRAAPLG